MTVNILTTKCISITRNMKKLIKYLFFGSLLMFLVSCIKEEDKYQRPEWLAGKLYDQVVAQEDLTAFARALEITGYDTIINTSGSFTVFSPTNQAVEEFLSENPQYGDSLENIPKPELEKLVKYHIIQNPWSKTQLQSLNQRGWITEDDDPIYSKPWAYKRQTLLSSPNETYYVRNIKGEFTIVDSITSNEAKEVYNLQRKFVPIFFDEYFVLNQLNYQDYTFYFNRSYEVGNIYYGSGKLGDEEIFAENGFVYRIDKVLSPALNAKQLLETERIGNSYKEFLKLIFLFPEFRFNSDATYDQPEARAGLQFDSLFNLSYPEITFNIHDEQYRNIERSMVSHYGLLAPDDKAFNKLVDEVITSKSGYPHWSSLEMMPDEIKSEIVNTHMSESPVYKTDIKEGFYNGSDDRIVIDESQINEKYYSSNCTFIGLNEAITPRVFSSVTGPIYLRPGYSTFMRAIQYTNVLPAIKRKNASYTLFTLSDNSLQMDSSLMLNWIDQDLNRYNFKAFDRSLKSLIGVSRDELTKRILNQVAVSLPTGFANKEFLENLAGNYIFVDNENNTVRGTAQNVFGYLGDSVITINPVELEAPKNYPDNGKVYDVNGWFNYSKATLYSSVTGKFKDLLEKTGLIDTVFYNFSFISPGEYYTVLVPSDNALENFGAETLPKKELEKLLRYHFIRDELIFTDGKKPTKYYETSRVDETSNEYRTILSKIHLRPGPDYIDILDEDGNVYYTINEDPNNTNLITTSPTGEPSSRGYWDFITTGVIHRVDKVLIRQNYNIK
jgi:uncharacterized surface protein with fasciclin (FAS1) repeats